MVATAYPDASEAARSVAAAGGNAIDAAIAAAWALAVCEPSASGLGGQTTMLIRHASGRTVVVDGHSRAPAAASRGAVSRAEQRLGYRASSVPTTPATLAYAQRRYGRLAPARVMEPARRLAEEGYAISALQRRQLRWCRAALASTEGGRRYLRPDGRPPRAGAVFRQPALGRAVRRMAEHGVEDFYLGAIADAIAADMRRHDGVLTGSDLAGLRAPTEREPLTATYRGLLVMTVPPPGGGTELLVGLKLLEQLAPDGALQGQDRWHACLADATLAAFRERERRPVHPDEWTDDLGAWLVSEERARELASSRGDDPGAAWGPSAEEAGETTHLCTADDEGNVVSLTQSIQSLFGAKVANEGYGFLYNNYLATCPRRRHPYRLRGLAPVRSNAAPTLVTEPAGPGHPGRPVLALGGAGSRRIVSALLHVLTGVIDRGLGLDEALSAPRVHARLNGRVWLEQPAASARLVEALARGFGGVDLRPRHSYAMGAVQAIELRDDGTMVGGADPRRDGAARALVRAGGPARAAA